MDNEILIDACWAISCLSDGSDDKIQTAVARLHQLFSPLPSTVFYAILVHRMNISVTVAVLLRVPSVVNDFLSVMFVVSLRFKPEYLGRMYKIHKSVKA